MDLHSSDFGDGFIWGVASSAYQTEGASDIDGKGPSIWDAFTRRPGRIATGGDGRVACAFYERYVQDLILMQYLNIRHFRFSIAWSRLMPEGRGPVNEKGIDHYNRLIDFCLELGIEPWITLYHWDLPQALELRGGWANRDIVGWLCDYIELCLQRFGDRVHRWMVLNEPTVFTGAGYFLGLHAPGRKGLSSYLPAVHHAALAQAAGGRIVRSFDSAHQVGTTFSCAPVDPADGSKASLDAATRADVLFNRLFIEPLLGLGYPVADLKVLQGLERYMHPNDPRDLAFDMDFIGLQNYTREVVQYSPLIPYVNARLVKAPRRHVPCTDMDWEIYPEGIYRILKRMDAYKKVKRFLITENGAAFRDVPVNGRVHDPERIDFLSRYLAQVLRARGEGVPVDGYFAWSFTDNFEWAEGYDKRFGLVYVDYATQKRTIKSSGLWYRDFLAAEYSHRHAQAV